jgi:uncharacterized protein (DUF488 family)
MKKLFTIGFTKKSAEEFFNILKENEIDLIADVRLNNSGQLAGFTKKRDLIFFLSLFNIDFIHLIDFAPTKELRNAYHSNWDFEAYGKSYRDLLKSREAIKNISGSVLMHKNVCLLCSEAGAEKCHRSLAALEIAKEFNVPIFDL